MTDPLTPVFLVPNSVPPRLKCGRCDTEFEMRFSHDCTVTRKEFEEMRGELRDVAAVLADLLSACERAGFYIRSSVSRRERLRKVADRP